ncbi:MAG: hypothetical protein GXY03_03030 [Solirubrobacterales bacterium]|nr:hypothetical protein [Solirubrobacterales bacterium]
MILRLPRTQAEAIVGAMRSVALAHGDGAVSPADRATVAAAAEIVFGIAFWDHFERNGFAFPGNPGGLAEGFTTPHDSSHVLSGYSTSHVAADWDFWAATPVPLGELRDSYGVAPVDAALLA